MAAKTLTTEAIALTEKKMDMTLDDIIKMSKNTSSKPKMQQRIPNKSKKSQNNAVRDKVVKLRQYMDSRSALRQAAFAQRRSSFQGNQFPLAADHARKAVVAPIRGRPFNRGRAANAIRPRSGVPPVQRGNVRGGFVVKRPEEQVKVLPKQRPQTLDSLFANMKEQRMRIMSQQSNAGRRNGDGQQRQQWGRGRLGN